MPPERMVLRAEIFHRSRQIVAHTTAVTMDSVVVRTDEPLDPGDEVVVQLSFPRLLAPLALHAHVQSKDPGFGLGYFPGVTLELDGSEPQRSELAALLVPQSGTALVGYRVLLVEDSAVMRDAFQASADRFGGRVIVDVAETGEEALGLAKRISYDLALLDLFLPGPMSGADLVRELRKSTAADLPVIGFSVGGASARDQFLAAGADVFMDKPVMVKDLFATLERLMIARDRRPA
jgi:CheY-like chemotaxis protein